MAKYKAFYNQKTEDIEADNLYSAKQQAIRVFNAPKSKQHMVSVVLCERDDGTEVVHNGSEF